MDFIMSIIGRMEDEKHSMVLKEVLTLTTRYPACLTINVINKLSSMEDPTSSPSMKACIQELRNDYNVRTTREKISGSVTIVKVGGYGGSRGEFSVCNLRTDTIRY